MKRCEKMKITVLVDHRDVFSQMDFFNVIIWSVTKKFLFGTEDEKKERKSYDRQLQFVIKEA